MRRRVAGLAAVLALLALVAGSPAPALAGSPHPQTGAEWHRLHPALCHTMGDHSAL